MRRILRKGYYLTSLWVMMGFIQKAHAQKETFFHHFNWNQTYYSSAGVGSQGFLLNTLFRNFNDSTNYYFSVDVPLNKFNSALGTYYIHNTSSEDQYIQSGISYTGFIRLGQDGSLRLGAQGNRHQKAESPRTWAFQEYQTDTVYYSADASLFLQRESLLLGITAKNLLQKGSQATPDFTVFLGFHELQTNSWLRSSPYMLLQIRQGHELPEWRFNYSATIVNFLVLGGSYYKNSHYLYGLNGGFKIANTVWLTFASDFVDTKLPYRAIYELGLRINIRKKSDQTENHPQWAEDEQDYL